MVVALGPGHFYGSSLPRPHFYTDLKFNSERVDPPTTVTDPLLSWANEAHWSMGGLSFSRHRLQGRIEGSITKLRDQKKRSQKAKSASPSIAKKPQSVLEDSSSEEDEVVVETVERRKRARRLGEEFDRIAEENEGGSGGLGVPRMKRRRLSIVEDGVGEKRTSLRLRK